MKTTVLFFVILGLSSLVLSQKAFDKVKSLLDNFEKDIRDEQAAADIRNEKDTKQCKEDITLAEAKVAAREKDVKDLEDHITWLENEKAQNEKDKADREARIKANEEMLKRFKDERCTNNLFFVKQLREHMEAIDLLTALKEDIAAYFKKKKEIKPAQVASFIEKIAEFSHLFSEKKKAIFVELQSTLKDLPNVDELQKKVDTDTAQKQRTEAEVGTQHIDNTKEELKALEHVAYEKTDAYYAKLEAKINLMIDNLIEHLRESRRELERKEIKAAEDFAIFQTNIDKENEYLKTKIIELTKVIDDLTNQITIGQGQLAKRKVLLDQARQELADLIAKCKEKEEYYKKETIRRNGELETTANAKNIFNNILANLSQRIKERASNLSEGTAAGNELSKQVVTGKPTHEEDLSTRQGERAKVVF